MKNGILLNVDLSLILLFVVGTIVLFLICREVMCWYFKINELKKNQERTNYLLTKILVQNGGELNEEDQEALK